MRTIPELSAAYSRPPWQVRAFTSVCQVLLIYAKFVMIFCSKISRRILPYLCVLVRVLEMKKGFA